MYRLDLSPELRKHVWCEVDQVLFPIYNSSGGLEARYILYLFDDFEAAESLVIPVEICNVQKPSTNLEAQLLKRIELMSNVAYRKAASKNNSEVTLCPTCHKPSTVRRGPRFISKDFEDMGRAAPEDVLDGARGNGYYWIKTTQPDCSAQWKVALWDGEQWFPCNDFEFGDSDGQLMEVGPLVELPKELSGTVDTAA